MADETFGTLDVFMYASIAMLLIGWFLPRFLMPESWHLALASPFALFASVALLIAISGFTSLLIHLSQRNNFLAAIISDPVGGAAYVFVDSGSELSGFGLLALLISWVQKTWSESLKYGRNG
ncbi:MAG: hypothetical protein KAT26_09250 [Marinosulfonomonas sp.]|nr:hypothetical protein [Marinosulfonomonas sp.]